MVVVAIIVDEDSAEDDCKVDSSVQEKVLAVVTDTGTDDVPGRSVMFLHVTVTVALV